MINTFLFISFITNKMIFSLQKCTSKFEIMYTKICIQVKNKDISFTS